MKKIHLVCSVEINQSTHTQMNTLNDYCERFEELNANEDQVNAAKAEFLNAILDGIDVDGIDLPYHIDVETIEDANFDDIYDVITDELNDSNAFDQEIIYYGRAMDFLRENDPSLKNSLELAQDFGFEAKNLNSEILASLLASELCREEWAEAESLISDNVEEAREALDALLEELEAQAEEDEEEEERENEEEEEEEGEE